jgi:hypothetical protein
MNTRRWGLVKKRTPLNGMNDGVHSAVQKSNQFCQKFPGFVPAMKKWRIAQKKSWATYWALSGT